MCTTSIVRFRFSLKHNLTNTETLNNSIRSETKYYSLSGIGLNHKNKFLTQNHINMNKGLSNGHEFSLSNNIDINLNNNSDNINTTINTTSSTTSSTVSTCITPNITTSDNAMGLLNSNSKDNITQHLLLNSLKTGKPENGQRIDFTNISWNDLKQTTNTSNISTDLKNNEVSDNNDCDQLETHLDSNSPLIIDQTVEQLIAEELQQKGLETEEQVKEEDHKLVQNFIVKEDVNEEEREPLSSVIVNELNEDNRTISSSVGPQSEPIDIKAQQIMFEKQTERLMRRIKRLQFKQIHRHITKQMKSFVENQQLVTGITCQRMPEVSPHLHSVVNPNEDRMKFLTPDGVKGLSTSALVSLVKRLGSNTANTSDVTLLRDIYQQQQQQQQTPLRPQTISFTSTSITSNISPQVPQPSIQISSNSTEDTTLVKLLQKSQASTSSGTVSQLSHVKNGENIAITSTIDSLTANLRHFETGFDSDATDSSSGGESCDEFEDYNHDSNQQNSTPILNTGHFIPMRKRSCWKWCLERGSIASRWVWLQAQVADLEFRIRQQNEMYRQLRATKGHISYGTGEHNLSVPTSLVSKVNTLSIALSSTTNNVTTNSLQQQNEQKVLQTQQSSTESDSQYCMRTLPLNSMRKRKLVRSMNALSGATRKAAKYSTVQCVCNGLPNIVSPCVLCNGRYSYVHVIDTDCMPYFERVALLDSSCHPVLSLSNDVSLGLHFSELLKRETIQKPIPSRQQNRKRKSPPSPTIANKFIFDSKNKSPKRSQSVISSTKLRKKYDVTAKRKYVRRSGPTDGVWRKRGRPRERASSGSSRTESPIPSPVPSDGSGCGNLISAPLHRRRRSEQQHAFDINNIVIPYSIAATTRVEKLQYKEIITPKWRTNEPLDDSSLSLNDINSQLNDTKPLISQLVDTIDESEDISDTSFTLRHAKCEEEERKRILAFMKGSTKQSGTHLRGRGARVRFDSTRSDTLNSNPPSNGGGDNAIQNVDSTSQDSYSGTPTALVHNFNNESINNAIPESLPAMSERRRNTSLSSKREDSIDESYEAVSPFDLRTFPLSDISYDLMSRESTHLYSCEEENIDLINDPEKSNEGTITANNSRAASPINSEAAESIADHIEDIDNEDEDPEWEPKK